MPRGEIAAIIGAAVVLIAVALRIIPARVPTGPSTGTATTPAAVIAPIRSNPTRRSRRRAMVVVAISGRLHRRKVWLEKHHADEFSKGSKA